MIKDIDKFILDQLSVWPDASENYRKLKRSVTRQLVIDGLEVTIQHNPSRIISTAAEPATATGPCFLCDRPEKQRLIKFEGRKGRKYDISINLYPIFPKHLVIASEEHVDQCIWHRYTDMLDMAEALPDYVITYNGPASGASAPFHMHFQAMPKGILPLQAEAERILSQIACAQPDEGVPNDMERAVVPESLSGDVTYVASVQDAQLFHYKHFMRGIFMLRARTTKSMAKQFYRLLDSVSLEPGESEPRFNAVTYFSEGEYRAVVVCRSKHRSSHYHAEGENHYMLSPGCVDVHGFVITPRQEDYDRITSAKLGEIFDEVSVSSEEESKIIWRLTRTQPTIQVGIMSAPEIVFEIISDGAGPQKVSIRDGKIDYNGALYDELCFDAQTISTLFAEPSFILHDVVIGINFHWERKVNQKFAGSLKFIVENKMITAVNVIGVEDYLLSVISSEMKSSSTLEFLMAHSVISRSWVMSQIRSRGHKEEHVHFNATDVPALVTELDTKLNAGEAIDTSSSREVPSHIEWFGHSDHKNFDVCADDHCQRYQGLTMAVGDNVRTAIDRTWGQVMMSEGEIVDARFYKSCGGAMEEFSAGWEDHDYPYLVGKLDSDCGDTLPDLTREDEVRRWILCETPEPRHAFCNTEDENILSQVLNDYDLETKDFYRWKVEYGIDYISNLFRERSGVDLGTITGLIPLKRGKSGRLVYLRVVGTKGSLDIGKELIIRRYFSESHLKSSAFIWEFTEGKLILRGAGWGHGVGLCQIGAAVMAYSGYSYQAILQHYYPGHELVRQ